MLQLRDMWAAGLYPIAVIVAVLSAVWPYLKLLAMLWLWAAPTSLVGER